MCDGEREIDGNKRCKELLEHCNFYFKPFEMNKGMMRFFFFNLTKLY